ncbi:hypothetical protein BHOIPH791_00600 [Bartonella henselae]|nr:hypothetical protein BH623125_09540 [Bartonella henselae]GFF03302.1 hypothetical protein BH80429_01230 [Bartonella henselae]
MNTEEEYKRQHPLSKCSNTPITFLQKIHINSAEIKPIQKKMQAPKIKVSVTIYIPHTRDNSLRIQTIPPG